jgi:hypothetical protein
LPYKARIYVRRPEERAARYIGEKELRERPIKDGRVTFAHQGKMETAVVELIAPDDWEKRDLTPTVTVVQTPVPTDN